MNSHRLAKQKRLEIMHLYPATSGEATFPDIFPDKKSAVKIVSSAQAIKEDDIIRNDITKRDDKAQNADFANPDTPSVEDPSPYQPKPVNLDELHEMDAADKLLAWWAEDGVYVRYDATAQVWYTYEDNLYRELTQRDAVYVMVNQTVRDREAKAKGATLKSIASQLAKRSSIRMDAVDPSPEMLPLANGILNITTREFVKASPCLFYTQRGEVSYDPNATCPTFDTWLDGVLPDKEQQNTLLEYMAYSLTGYTHLQKFLFLYGQGGTGKGTISHVLEKLSGGFFASSDLNSLGSSRFATHTLRDKRLALISEVSKKRVNLKTLKQITGEDAVLLERKYKDPYHKKLDTKLFITANEMFSLGTDTNNDSIDRRLIILPLEIKQTDNPDLHIPNLEATLEGELSGILNRLVDAWDRLTAQGGFTLPHGDEDLFRSFLQDSNLIMYFFSSEFEEGDAWGDFQVKDLYYLYKEWCKETGHKRETETKFSRSLKSTFEKLSWNIEQKKPNNKSMWRGLTLKEDSRLL